MLNVLHLHPYRRTITSRDKILWELRLHALHGNMNLQHLHYTLCKCWRFCFHFCLSSECTQVEVADVIALRPDSLIIEGEKYASLLGFAYSYIPLCIEYCCYCFFFRPNFIDRALVCFYKILLILLLYRTTKSARATATN